MTSCPDRSSRVARFEPYAEIFRRRPLESIARSCAGLTAIAEARALTAATCIVPELVDVEGARAPRHVLRQISVA